MSRKLRRLAIYDTHVLGTKEANGDCRKLVDTACIIVLSKRAKKWKELQDLFTSISGSECIESRLYSSIH